MFYRGPGVTCTHQSPVHPVPAPGRGPHQLGSRGGEVVRCEVVREKVWWIHCHPVTITSPSNNWINQTAPDHRLMPGHDPRSRGCPTIPSHSAQALLANGRLCLASTTWSPTSPFYENGYIIIRLLLQTKINFWKDYGCEMFERFHRVIVMLTKVCSIPSPEWWRWRHILKFVMEGLDKLRHPTYDTGIPSIPIPSN